MTEDNETYENFIVPDDQKSRQAIGGLRGYIYQLYQTLASWLDLKDDETLLLEVAEDFAILAKDTLVGTQVKETAGSGSITLHTKSVRDTISSLWSFQKANPERIVYINYLTTSNLGKEKGLSFPGKQSGLVYWRKAAREGSEILPLRQGLQTLDLAPEILAFLRDATDDQIRDTILRRIKWICAAENTEILDQTIRDRLIYLGEKYNATPSESERAKDSLLAKILDVVVREDEQERRLSRADLLRVFGKATSGSLPMPQIRALIAGMHSPMGGVPGVLAPGAGSVIDIHQVPLPPLALQRQELVTTLVMEMGRSDVLWLHGSTGTGKTVLSCLISRRSPRKWFLLHLRDCSSESELDLRFQMAIQAISSGNLGGIILDDLPVTLANRMRPRLSILLSEMRRVDGNLIVTASEKPPPSLQNWIGDIDVHVVNVVYLTKEEIAELVTASGGNADKWANVVHIFCGFGHPQLVCARVSGLRHRGWPDGELLDGLKPLAGPAIDIDSERDAIRKRLILELPDNARELLYRLTMVGSYFDRELALSLGGLAPVLTHSGESLDMLIGPWIEVVANDRFTVSPLVSDAWEKNINKACQLQIHNCIVDHLMARKPFPAEFLAGLLSHALASHHQKGLLWLSIAVLHVRDDNRSLISEHLLLLSFLTTDAPLFPERIGTSVLLRMAQFRVAATLNHINRLQKIAVQLIHEAKLVEDPTLSDYCHVAAISQVLLEERSSLNPKKWLPLLIELETVLSRKGEIACLVENYSSKVDDLGHMTVIQFIFAKQAISLCGVDGLVELITELDHLTLEHRECFLSSLREPYLGYQLMVQHAWLADVNSGRFDAGEVLIQLQKLCEIAEEWSNPDLEIECECARAVMLDEYQDNSEAAHAILDIAARKYPNSVRLARGRSTVYCGSRNHRATLDTLTPILDRLSEKDHVGRAFVFRDAAICAANLEELPRASSFFAKAYEAARQGSYLLPMAIGLKGDEAITEFKAGNRSKALKLLAQALNDMEEINSEAGINEKFCQQALGHVILWMKSKIHEDDLQKRDYAITPGCCSHPNPAKEYLNKKSPPSLLFWYQLAELEAKLQIDIGILQKLRKRTAKKKMPSCELMLSFEIMARHVCSIDIVGFVAYLPEYTAIRVYIQKRWSKTQGEDVCIATEEEIRPVDEGDWAKEPYQGIAKDAILAVAINAVCSRVTGWKPQLLENITKIKGADVSLIPFLQCFNRERQQSDDLCEIVATHIGCLGNAGKSLNPAELFLMTFHLWNWLSQSAFGRSIGVISAQYFERRWKSVIENQRLLLKDPFKTVPAIQTALDNMLTGADKIAALVIATEDAVNCSLAPDVRAKLRHG